MTDATEPDATTLAPDEAFSVLGNETRIEILQTLGNAHGALSFSELRERVGMRDSGRFNYHLGQLTGHFVTQADTGYELRRPGKRVVEAVLSGAVTEAPMIERTEIDWACHYCGARPIEMEYREEQVGVYCTECEGMYGGSNDKGAAALPAERNRLFYSHLPPAGVFGRSPEEVLLAAATWTNAELVLLAHGICPRCSARLEVFTSVCDTHSRTNGLCEECNRRYAALHRVRCENCVYGSEIVLASTLLVNLELRVFMIDHGLNPIFPESHRWREMFIGPDEHVRSVDPLEVAYTFTIDEDVITLTVDETGDVIDVTQPTAADGN